MRQVIKSLLSILVIGFLAPSSVNAIYNANLSGKITGIWAYTEADHIYFRLDNQPTSHPTCNPNFFVIDASLPAPRMDRLFARALTAKTTGETINIGYDATTECQNGYLKVHRIG